MIKFPKPPTPLLNELLQRFSNIRHLQRPFGYESVDETGTRDCHGNSIGGGQFTIEEEDWKNNKDSLKAVNWNKEYVLLERSSEAYFPYYSMNLLHREIRKYNYPANKIIFWSGDENIEVVYSKWKLESEFKDDDPINVIGCSSYFEDVLTWFGNMKSKWNIADVLKKNILLTDERDNLFLYFNKRMTHEKTILFEEIKGIGGLDVSLYSAIDYGIYLDNKEFFKVYENCVSQLYGDRYDSPETSPDKLGYQLNTFYENTYFETFCSCEKSKRVAYRKRGGSDRIHIDEKSVKPLLQGHPFISLSHKHHHKTLRKKGYETYPELFDESYDNLDDIDERRRIVVSEIKRYIDMWNKDKSEVHKIFSQDSILEKRKHNQNWLIYHDNSLEDLLYKVSRIVN